MVVPFSPVADGVTNEENAEEYAEQYREPEPENEYREQELGFEDGKSNLIFWCIFIPVLQPQSIGLFIKLHNIL